MTFLLWDFEYVILFFERELDMDAELNGIVTEWVVLWEYELDIDQFQLTDIKRNMSIGTSYVQF